MAGFCLVAPTSGYDRAVKPFREHCMNSGQRRIPNFNGPLVNSLESILLSRGGTRLLDLGTICLGRWSKSEIKVYRDFREKKDDAIRSDTCGCLKAALRYKLSYLIVFNLCNRPFIPRENFRCTCNVFI